jgi:hypothetical protein
MATKEIPFAESFGNYGDPRRYMNKGISPGKKVEQFVAKVRNSPLASLIGIGAAGDGTTTPVPAPVPAPALGQGVSVPSAPSIGVNANIPGAVAFGAAPIPQVAPTVMPAQDADGDGQIDSFWGVKPVGPQSSVDVRNPTDFNPLAPDTSNQLAVSGSDYEQIPGFGSAQEKAGKLMKIMGMG